MPSLIPLYQTNPCVRLIRRREIDNHQTERFMRGYSGQLIYVCEGHGFLQAPSGYLSLRPGTAALISAGEAHNLIAYTREKLSLIQICFDYTQLNRQSSAAFLPVPARQFDEKRAICDVLPSEIPQSKGCLCLSNMQHMARTLDDMMEVFQGGHRFGEALLSGQFKTLLCGIFANIDPVKPRSENRAGEHMVLDVVAYLDYHYMERVSNAGIAAQLNYHPNYLNKQMVRFTGKSLHQQLIDYRIARATELLLFSSASIGDIARSTGFNSSCHFSKLYQQRMGCSPSGMRTLYSDSSSYAMRAFDAVAQKHSET